MQQRPLDTRTPPPQPLPSAPTVNPDQPPLWRRRRILVLVAALLLLVLGGAGAFLVLRPDAGNPQRVIGQVGRHAMLPKDEEPVIATVTDPAKLPDQTFLKQARAGDKILFYQKAKKVIIYRPGIDKIVDIGPLSVAQPKQ